MVEIMAVVGAHFEKHIPQSFLICERSARC